MLMIYFFLLYFSITMIIISIVILYAAIMIWLVWIIVLAKDISDIRYDICSLRNEQVELQDDIKFLKKNSKCIEFDILELKGWNMKHETNMKHPITNEIAIYDDMTWFYYVDDWNWWYYDFDKDTLLAYWFKW